MLQHEVLCTTITAGAFHKWNSEPPAGLCSRLHLSQDWNWRTVAPTSLFPPLLSATSLPYLEGSAQKGKANQEDRARRAAGPCGVGRLLCCGETKNTKKASAPSAVFPGDVARGTARRDTPTDRAVSRSSLPSPLHR
ncbi:unnamed protein product [Pleuronectes platessa]|uniref:Uncharacterized protein n=1 Tax=Pleuronectes platessa TaxID=8262 RepID=A0A9N7V7V0_PLEPL|nr:unnamed protein product [Pleuronectes platessa]